MITFWLICAIFVAIALAFVLPPLLRRSDEPANKGDQGFREANLAVYRDQLSELESDRSYGIVSQEQYEQDREEIERRLLEDLGNLDVEKMDAKAPVGLSWVVYLVAMGLPVLGVALYLYIGDQRAFSAPPTPQRAPMSQSDESGVSEESIAANIAALREKLQTNPEDALGWTMLGRSYSFLERYSEASEAYEKATGIVKDDADLWADFAFAQAMANSRTLKGRPTELIRRALQVDAENPKALELAGSAAFEAQNYKQAITHWEKLLKKLPEGSEIASSVNERISRARELGGAN